MKEIGESRLFRTQGVVFRLLPENSSPRSSASYHPAATFKSGTPVRELGKSSQNNTKRSANSEIFYKEILEISQNFCQAFFLVPAILTTQQPKIVSSLCFKCTL